MENVTPGQLWGWIATILTAIVLIGNAAEKIAKGWKAAQAPNAEQNDRLTALERRMEDVEKKLRNDKEQLDTIENGLRASYQAQLALLDHGIDGNNIEQMQHAKEVLRIHLINK